MRNESLSMEASPMQPKGVGCICRPANEAARRFEEGSIFRVVDLCVITPEHGFDTVARSDRYRYEWMDWLKHCSIDYRREGLIDNEMDLPWPRCARGDTTPEATVRPRSDHHARGVVAPKATRRHLAQGDILLKATPCPRPRPDQGSI